MNVTHQTGAFQVRDGYDSKTRKRVYSVVEVKADSLRVWEKRQRSAGFYGFKSNDDRHHIEFKRAVERFPHTLSGLDLAEALCDQLGS
jgi:hypothetical protein